jgi:hypothetical protein
LFAGGLRLLVETFGRQVVTVFSRSGLHTVAAGKSSGTVTGVAPTAASLVLARAAAEPVRDLRPLRGARRGGSSFTVHLSKAPSAGVKVAWFVVN